MFCVLNLDQNRIVRGIPDTLDGIDNIIIFVDNNDIDSKMKIETAIQKTKIIQQRLADNEIDWCRGLLLDGSSELIYSYEKYNVIKNITKLNIISIFNMNIITENKDFKDTIVSAINDEIEKSGKLFLSYDVDVIAQHKDTANPLINNKDKKNLSDIERKERTKRAFLEILKKKQNKERKNDKKISPFGLKNVNKSNKSR